MNYILRMIKQISYFRATVCAGLLAGIMAAMFELKNLVDMMVRWCCTYLSLYLRAANFLSRTAFFYNSNF